MKDEIDLFGEYLEATKEEAKRQLVQFGHHNHILIVNQGNHVDVMSVMYDKESKNDMFDAMRYKLHESLGYVSINEAWFVRVSKDKAKDMLSIIPSEHPDKKEMLMLMAVSEDRCIQISVPFHKEDGKIVFEKEESHEVPMSERKFNKLDAWAYDPIAEMEYVKNHL